MINIKFLKKNFIDNYNYSLKELEYERNYVSTENLTDFDNKVNLWNNVSLKIINNYNRCETFLEQFKYYFNELNIKDIYDIKIDSEYANLKFIVYGYYNDFKFIPKIDINKIYDILNKINYKYEYSINLFNRYIEIKIKFK